jgi:tetratricopeptide (TPR) repeat protein
MAMQSHIHPHHGHKWPQWIGSVIALSAVVFFTAGALIWVFNVLGIIPIRSTFVLAAIFILNVICAFFLLVFLLRFLPPTDKEDSFITAPLPPEPQSQINHLSPVQTYKITYHDTGNALLPPTDPKFIQQREKVVKEVYKKLVDPNTSAIALTGIAGVGKSTLAALIYRYAEDQRRVGRGIFTAPPIWIRVDASLNNMVNLATKIYEALGKQPPEFGGFSPHEQAAALFHLMDKSDKVRLIILDQFDNLLDWQTGKVLPEYAGIGEWLNTLNGQRCTCRVLVSSQSWPRGDRDYPHIHMPLYPVKGLEIEEGIDLLRKQGIDASAKELSMAVKRCDGHAYSLILLTAILRRNRILNLKDLFENEMYLEFWRGDIASNLLDYIYMQQLDEVQRELLRAFSVYREAVPLDAVLPLIASNSSRKLLVIALKGLLAQYLLEATGKGHYQLHAIVADYARGHFVEHNEQDNQQALEEAHGKTVEYYLNQAALNNRPWERRKRKDLHPLIEAIWQLCQAREWEKAYTLMEEESVFEDLKRLGDNAVLLELYQLLLPLEKWTTDPVKAIHIYSNLGRVFRTLGEKELAKKYLELALELCEQENKEWEKGAALSYLGRVYADLGEKERALKTFEEALRLRRAIGDLKGEGWTLDNLGRVQDELGQKELAQSYCEQALVVWRETRNRRGEGRTLSTLGRVLNSLGETEKAQEYLEKALAILREVGDRGGEGKTLHNLGLLYANRGEKERARQLYEEALSIRRETQYRFGEGKTLERLGLINEDLGRKEEALRYFKQALSVLREVGDQAGEINTLYNIGLLYFDQPPYDLALAFFLMAKSICASSPGSICDDNQAAMDNLREKLGRHQYDLLLDKVGSQVNQIIEQALQEDFKENR